MGKGGQSKATLLSTKAQEAAEKSTHWKSPYNPKDPNVQLPKIGEIKAAIPKHCFERSYVKSLYYTMRDTAWAVGCVYVTSQVLSTDMPSEPTDLAVWALGWSLYAFAMGTIMFGPWILAHECGHGKNLACVCDVCVVQLVFSLIHLLTHCFFYFKGAFSPNQTFNDFFGFIMHQILLVPYFAWQYSHAKHHRRVNHLVDGESHVPSGKADVGLTENNERFSYLAVLHEAFGDSGFAAFRLGFYLLVGYPMYLLGLGSTGKLAHDGTPLGDKLMDHYRPGSPLFPGKVYWKILLSTVTQFSFIGSLLYAGQFHYGHRALFLWYWAPYLWVNAWLVIYTWLHHTDASVPHYGTDDWTWLKGALATIDRPYGEWLLTTVSFFDFFDLSRMLESHNTCSISPPRSQVSLIFSTTASAPPTSPIISFTSCPGTMPTRRPTPLRPTWSPRAYTTTTQHPFHWPCGG